MTMDELEDLSNEAWRRRIPFIMTGEGFAIRAIEPSLFREQRIMNGMNNAFLDILRFASRLNFPEDDWGISICVGECK